MPQRFLQRNLVFSVQDFYTRFLSSLPGWATGSAEDIASITWDPAVTARTLTITRVQERDLVRFVVFTAAEIYTLTSGAPGWGGGTAADIKTVTYDPAGRKVAICKVSEAA